ncbi:hypothetical protein A6456_34785 [Paraburkholderia tropica]|nr:hypothetical protein A6456_34785 [Paraburkholderia tropica]
MHTSLLHKSVDASDLAAEATNVRDQVGALQAWFGQQPDMHCLLVVERSQRDPVAGDGSASPAFARLHRTDVVIDHEALSPAHWPCLLTLDLQVQSGMSALEESVRMAFEDRRPQSMTEGLGQRIGGWLASSASPGEIASHFSRLALQRDDRNRLCLLRFYDSRAQALLWPLLTQSQQHALLGPVRAWHTLDAGARPVTRMNTQGRRADFALEPAQWDGIHRHGIVNRALARHAYENNRQSQPHEVDTAVAAAMRAQRYGLTDEEDQIAFVGHALAWHPEFDLHPRVLQILGHRSEDDFYTGLIDELSQDEIADIRQGIWHERLRASANVSRPGF